jgi:hypothetical protein
MDASEPRPRHRGYFLNAAEEADADLGEQESAEGITIRVRIFRPRLKQRGSHSVRGSVVQPVRFVRSPARHLSALLARDRRAADRSRRD